MVLEMIHTGEKPYAQGRSRAYFVAKYLLEYDEKTYSIERIKGIVTCYCSKSCVTK